ncbi:hypothetical protein M0R04_00170 [Candidatus Dojkabacteria bacterium]|jgi:hypothetical protein|nr:hypothetical protein [Candidatus Dojkabacteria bacterium]
MKKYIYTFFLNILVFSFVFKLFTGIKLPKDLMYVGAAYIILSLAVLLYRPFLKFLTVKINFITFWLCVSLLLIGTFFALDSFLPEFHIVTTTIKAMDLGTIKIAAIEMNKILTIVFTSMSIAFVSAIMEFLKRNDD